LSFQKTLSERFQVMQTNSQKIPVVWTEIGRRPGQYVLNAIKVHAQMFPGTSRYIVLSKEFATNVKIEKCIVIYEEDLKQTDNSRQFTNQRKDWEWSQSSYWTNTTRRFFVLEQFMKTFAQEKLIHLESDCVLLEDRFILDLFLKDDWGIKFTKQDSLRGCASVFLVNSVAKLECFNSFILNHWSEPDQTDMTLLSKYQRIIDIKTYLPSGNLIDSEIVFDAGTIGRYFLGGDARNHRVPFSRRGLESTGKEYFDPRDFKIIKSGPGLYLENLSGEKIRLACVHIHSKRVPSKLETLTRKLISESSSKRGIIWKVGVLDVQVVKERINSFVRRRIFRDKISDPRYR